MGIFWGKPKKKSQITSQDRAVLQLKQQRDRLEVYQKKLDVSLEKDQALAKQLLKNGAKEKARLLLKKKHYIEKLQKRCDSQLENLENLVHDIEFARIEQKVVAGLKVGNDALKELNQLLSLEKVEELLEETKEGIEKQEEINSLLIGQFTSHEEDCIEEELSAILIDELPKVPDSEIPEISKDVINAPTGVSESKRREKVAVSI